jgi:16S rRNA (adenine1518-N6/adenine1519-N6)-dimethyltransferase
MGARSQLVKSYKPNLKKRFGQHFLRDKGVIDRIVRWIKPVPGDLILEIGAGDGALSSRLAPLTARFIAVELDADCVPLLEAELERFEAAFVVPADILQLDLKELVSRHMGPGLRLRIAGNLPYNIASAIIDRLLHSGLPYEDMFFMVQLEVAQRILAKPGCREYGFLSVDCQHHADVRMGFKVSPACFVPRPKVSSATVSFRPRLSPLDPALEPDFEALAKAAFGYRRKTLANSLVRHPVFGKISGALLKRAGIDGSRRAEDLSVREFERLAQVFHDCFAAAANLGYTSPLNPGNI